ncbi:TetR/AcrR family transcriptional regulator [Neptunomonas japonica]|uniref:TetR/AcrR family transcriptional regulator n=1 Tax=Neptunomonas japonica TaxID=417574 RepID=UPI0003F74CD6|nr:TetR/AcrR family transcriptional regulator [Neptunomonas japonica]
MGRPSKKAERTEQILQALQRCVARYGLEGSTLERISEEAGLQRSLVRHFAGNRTELVTQLADRVIERSDKQWSEFISYLPEQDITSALLNGLFTEDHSDAEFVLVIESLIFAAGQDEPLRKQMQAWMSRFTNDMKFILLRDNPSADDEHLNAIAFGLVSIYFNLDSLAPLNMSAQYRPSARRAAELLVNTLIPATK